MRVRDQPQQDTALDLAPLPTAVPSARLHARLVMAEWGLAAIADDCELIVSELTTNAIRAAQAARTAAGAPPIRLRLTRRAASVVIEVWDGCDERPRPRRDLAPDASGGRGLLIVETLAQRWGTYATEGGGKVTYAVLATTLAASHTAG